MKLSIKILDSTATTYNVTGTKYKAAGYYGYKSNLHTVSWQLTDFKGRIYIEGSLATDPTSNDWFSVILNGDYNYFQYPINAMTPTGTYGDTGVFAQTFKSNIVWIRARVDRSYLDPLPPINQVGLVDQILLNY